MERSGVLKAGAPERIFRNPKSISTLRGANSYYLWKAVLPRFAVVLISYLAFWIRITDYYTQISITLTVILTEIAFRFAITTSLPKVAYLTWWN